MGERMWPGESCEGISLNPRSSLSYRTSMLTVTSLFELLLSVGLSRKFWVEAASLQVHRSLYSPHPFLHKSDPPDHLQECPLVHLKACLLDLLEICPLVHLKACPLAHLEGCLLVHLVACPLDLLEECPLVHLEECPPECVCLLDVHRVPCLVVHQAVYLALLSLHVLYLMGHIVVAPL